MQKKRRLLKHLLREVLDEKYKNNLIREAAIPKKLQDAVEEACTLLDNNKFTDVAKQLRSNKGDYLGDFNNQHCISLLNKSEYNVAEVGSNYHHVPYIVNKKTYDVMEFLRQGGMVVRSIKSNKSISKKQSFGKMGQGKDKPILTNLKGGFPKILYLCTSDNTVFIIFFT